MNLVKPDLDMQFWKIKKSGSGFLILLILVIFLSAFIIYQNGFYLKETAVNVLIDIGIKEDSTSPYAKFDNTSFVYLAYMDSISPISSMENDNEGLDLPKELVIKPGVYKFLNQTYDLTNEGLYRFFNLGFENQQRIVYSENLDALLSSISWIYTHGNSDDTKSYEEINEKAMNSKIFGTCGKISSWIRELLSNGGYESRVVWTLTLEPWNTYDNGHTMIEVFRNDFNKWVIYDLDNNAYFTKNNIPLSYIEFVQYVQSDEYEIKYLSKDSKLDISNFKNEQGSDFSFISESIYANEETLRKWYKRVIQVMLIQQDDTSFFFDDRDPERVQGYTKNIKYLGQEEFMKKFYSVSPIT